MRVLQNIANRHNKVALLIGNGPNLAANIMPSWTELLKSLADNPINFHIDGLSNTEVYDLVELNSKNPFEVKEKVKHELGIGNENIEIHRRLMNFAQNHDAPVLTTNFDNAFEVSINTRQYHIESKGFTRFYPWKTYYGHSQLRLPTSGFGIWKIHGDIRYKDSIRLGLTDYMGSVERARKLIHSGDESLFRGKRRENWQGHKTWLHIWFNLPIVIMGLGFGIDEVFLRWLLIERKRYLNIYNDPMEVYYISKNTPIPSVKNLMENLGVEIKLISDYSEIYG